MLKPKGFLKRLLHRSRSSKDKTTELDSTPTTTTNSSLLEDTTPSTQPAASSRVESASGTPSELSGSIVSPELPPFTQPFTSVIATTGSTTAPDRGNDKFGLFPINLNAQGLSTTEGDSEAAQDVETYPIDIVAVHGITGDAYNTWTHGNNKLWLRDFLNDDLPGARIFSYGYDASVFFSLATGSFEEFAETLLGHVKQTRTSQASKARPLIFICHSMGGIIVKEAIITTLVKGAMFENIRKSCLGIIFLGTPHRGSKAVGFSTLLATIVNVATIGSSRLFGRARTELLNNLEREAPILDSISGKFVEQTRSIQIATFVEMNATPPAKDRIVDRHSAVMHVAGEQIFDMQGCNHTSICRFPERNSNYGLILGVLKEWWSEFLPQNIAAQEHLPIAPSISSLKFPEMDYKKLELEDKAHSETCTWIFNRPPYVTWHNEPQGLLWIKGKPGAGKSTIMKTLVDRFELQKSSRFIVLAFFFNAFGDPNKPLKNSAAGMYRVLLTQLLEQVPSAAFRFQRFYERMKAVRLGHTIEWREEDQNQIRKFLNTELENLDTGAVNIRILVDAIDEDAQGKSHEVGRYLFDLDNRLRRLGKDVRVCVSSRHFPVAPVPEKHTIVLEKENLHDIAIFVENEFDKHNIIQRESLELNGALSELKRQIVDRSAGIFLWVSLVLQIVIDRLNKGDPIQKVMARLDAAPPRLGQIYSDMLNNIIQPEDRGDAYSLLSWAATASEPMLLSSIATEVDFSYPIYISSDGLQDERNNELQRLGLYIGSHSGGLMEARYYDELESSYVSVALFIHQTVRTFLRETGLQQLRDQLPMTWSSASSTSDEDEERLEIRGTRKPELLAESKYPGPSNHLHSDNFSQNENRERKPGPNDEAQSGNDSIFPGQLVADLSSVLNSGLFEEGQRGKSDSYAPSVNKSLSLLSDRWFETLERDMLPLVEPDMDTKRVKIAILDTGIDIGHPLLAGKRAGMIYSNSGDFPSDFSDTEGHGTHVAGLLLKIAPRAELFIAKVSGGGSDGEAHRQLIDAQKVATAIEYAVDTWNVDIITMSFGFSATDPRIQTAINKAHAKNVIMFAAASDGINHDISFPARSSQVICINSADGYGNQSDFNPPPVRGKDNFSVLGEALESIWPESLGHGPRARKSGTSYSAAVAAGIAAFIIDFARQSLPADSPELSAVSSPEGMRSLFSYMSSSREGFGYIVPWKLLTTDSSRERNVTRILRVLQSRQEIPSTMSSGDPDAQVQGTDAIKQDERRQSREVFEVDDEGRRIQVP